MPHEARMRLWHSSGYTEGISLLGVAELRRGSAPGASRDAVPDAHCDYYYVTIRRERNRGFQPGLLKAPRCPPGAWGEGCHSWRKKHAKRALVRVFGESDGFFGWSVELA